MFQSAGSGLGARLDPGPRAARSVIYKKIDAPCSCSATAPCNPISERVLPVEREENSSPELGRKVPETVKHGGGEKVRFPALCARLPFPPERLE